MGDLKTPQVIQTSFTVTSLAIDVRSMTLGVSVSLMVRLLTSNGSIADVQVMEMSGDDYNNWGDDDSYVVTFCLNKLAEIYPGTNWSLVSTPRLG